MPFAFSWGCSPTSTNEASSAFRTLASSPTRQITESCTEQHGTPCRISSATVGMTRLASSRCSLSHNRLPSSWCLSPSTYAATAGKSSEITSATSRYGSFPASNNQTISCFFTCSREYLTLPLCRSFIAFASSVTSSPLSQAVSQAEN